MNNDMYAQWRLRSDSMGILNGSPRTKSSFWGEQCLSEDWSGCVDAQADLSLCCVHIILLALLNPCPYVFGRTSKVQTKYSKSIKVFHKSTSFKSELEHDKNQQNDLCTQRLKIHISLGIHPVRSLISLRNIARVLNYPENAQLIQWRLIRLSWCTGWSESLLGAQVILLFFFHVPAQLSFQTCLINSNSCQTDFQDKSIFNDVTKYFIECLLPN